MSKIFYNKTTGDGAIFDNAEDMSNWPDFQENATIAFAIQQRTQRNILLAASDHMAMSDRITEEWRTYRQALRDVPAQAGFPTNITWPTEPS